MRAHRNSNTEILEHKKPVPLFCLKMNNIVKCLNPGVDYSLYVDDFLICYRSKNMNTIERQLQLNLNKIQKWSTENEFKFSKSKTVCMHFCHLRKTHNDPILTLDGTRIPVVEEKKFIGIVFYSSHQTAKSKMLKSVEPTTSCCPY